MKKAKLFTLLAALTISLGATSCALPDILYTTVEGHQHTIAHYYNSYHHWDECTECGERFNIEEHVYEEITSNENEHSALCTVCGYGLTEEHAFTYEYLDETYHAYSCDFCGYYVKEEHDLVLTATTGEVYNEETEEDEEVEGHVSRCACGYELDDFEEHYTETVGYYADNDEHYKICDTCGCIYDRENHSHAYDDEETAESTHGVYDEDDDSGYYGYYIMTYTCEVCGKQYTELYNLSEEDYNERYSDPDEPE